MSQLVIEVDTPEDEALLMQLLPQLNARVVGKQDETVQKPSFIEIARKIADRRGVIWRSIRMATRDSQLGSRT